MLRREVCDHCKLWGQSGSLLCLRQASSCHSRPQGLSAGIDSIESERSIPLLLKREEEEKQFNVLKVKVEN